MSDLPGVSDREATVIRLLYGRPKYGLELVKESGGLLSRNTIHVLLGRMVTKGFVVRSRQMDAPAGESGPPRRLYKVTVKGHRAVTAYTTWNGEK